MQGRNDGKMYFHLPKTDFEFQLQILLLPSTFCFDFRAERGRTQRHLSEYSAGQVQLRPRVIRAGNEGQEQYQEHREVPQQRDCCDELQRGCGASDQVIRGAVSMSSG